MSLIALNNEKKQQRFFVVLIVNVPQSNVNYVTNLTISLITSHACSAHIKHLYVKRINICIDKRNEFEETFVYLSQMKRYLRLSKNMQFCELRYPMCIICIRRGTHITIEANVRTIT